MGRTKKKKHDTEQRYVHKLLPNAPEGMDVWQTIQQRAMDSTKRRCSMNPFHKASAVHHVRYGRYNLALRRWKPIRGYEKPGYDVFPLCGKCHSKAHTKKNWHNERRDFVFGSRNAKAYQWRIELAWSITSLVVKIPKIGWLFAVWDTFGIFSLVPVLALAVIVLGG